MSEENQSKASETAPSLDMPPGFLRQRRNLMITSILLILMSLAVKEVKELSLAGVKLELGSGLVGPLGTGLVVLGYLAWRFYQYGHSGNLFPDQISKLNGILKYGLLSKRKNKNYPTIDQLCDAARLHGRNEHYMTERKPYRIPHYTFQNHNSNELVFDKEEKRYGFKQEKKDFLYDGESKNTKGLFFKTENELNIFLVSLGRPAAQFERGVEDIRQKPELLLIRWSYLPSLEEFRLLDEKFKFRKLTGEDSTFELYRVSDLIALKTHSNRFEWNYWKFLWFVKQPNFSDKYFPLLLTVLAFAAALYRIGTLLWNWPPLFFPLPNLDPILESCITTSFPTTPNTPIN